MVLKEVPREEISMIDDPILTPPPVFQRHEGLLHLFHESNLTGRSPPPPPCSPQPRKQSHPLQVMQQLHQRLAPWGGPVFPNPLLMLQKQDLGHPHSEVPYSSNSQLILLPKEVPGVEGTVPLLTWQIPNNAKNCKANLQKTVLELQKGFRI